MRSDQELNLVISNQTSLPSEPPNHTNLASNSVVYNSLIYWHIDIVVLKIVHEKCIHKITVATKHLTWIISNHGVKLLGWQKSTQKNDRQNG